MSNGPFPLFLDDLRASTRGWTREERWSYLGVLDDMWRNGGSTAADDASLIDAADLKGEKNVAQTLAKIRSKCILTDGGRLTHPRLANELQKKRDIAFKRAAAGAASAAAKGQQKRQQNPNTDPPVLLGSPTLPYPTQEERTSPPPSGAPPSAKGSRLPADWELPAEWRAWAIAEGLANPDREAAKFRDFWLAKAGKDATKRDWQATWRTWVRKAIDWNGGANGQAEQAKRGDDDSLLARTKALLAERDARFGAGDPERASDPVLPPLPGGR